MAGLLDVIKEKAKQQYQQGLLNQVLTNPASIGAEIGQLFNPEYMSQVNPMTQEQAMDVALSAPMMAGTIKNVGKTAFEDAFDLAQRNAAMPISKGGLGLPATNTAMDRAKAMGFNVDVYHGQQPKSTKTYYEGLGYVDDDPVLNELKQVIPKGGKTEGGALWTSPDSFLASKYAGNTGVVYPLKIRSSDITELGFTTPFPKDRNQQKKWFDDLENFNRSLDRTKSRYFQEAVGNNKAVAIRNVEDNPGNSTSPYVSDVIGINTAPVRSRFAAFDPFRRNESDILAGVAAAPIGLLTDNKKKDKKK